MFVATNIIKKCKTMYVHSGYGTAFDGTGSWSFDNGFAKNVVIFGAGSSLSSHTDNCKNKFSMLGEGHTDDVNVSVATAEKKFSLNFSKAKTNFCLSLYYNGDNSCFLVNGNKIYNFKAVKNFFTS